MVVGDFEPSEILPILAKTFEGWKADKALCADRTALSSPISSRERETIATPDKENAVYLAGLSLPIKDDDPDYPALLVGNFILGGGGLSSRIADRLRQKGGLSYTAMSMFASRARSIPRRPHDPGDLQPDQRRQGRDGRRRRAGPPAPRRRQARRAGKGQDRIPPAAAGACAPLTRCWRCMLAENLFVGRTMQFQADLEQKIKALTPEAVERRAPQAPRSQAALGRHRGRFQEEVGSSAIGSTTMRQ